MLTLLCLTSLRGKIPKTSTSFDHCLLAVLLPLYHKSGLLGLYAALTVSDLFFVVFVEFYGVF